MDLIGTLTSQLGVGDGPAKALAGSVLGMVKSGVSDKLGAEAADQMDAAVPEAAGWQAEAKAQEESSGGGLGDMLGGALGGMLGGDGGSAAQLGSLIALASKLGLDESKAKMVVPMVAKFLESRLDGDLFAKIKSAAPILGMLKGGGEAEGGIAGTIGSLFG